MIATSDPDETCRAIRRAGGVRSWREPDRHTSHTCAYRLDQADIQLRIHDHHSTVHISAASADQVRAAALALGHNQIPHIERWQPTREPMTPQPHSTSTDAREMEAELEATQRSVQRARATLHTSGALNTSACRALLERLRDTAQTVLTYDHTRP
ncbi:hypothetical protein [Sciscionella marina]|uniref:hypothetical protein n=1 Tax=Sciscionella marina TaxID=508770 RepID=UPI000372FFED|nr:hypothetical protein [Sciscionella marina]